MGLAATSTGDGVALVAADHPRARKLTTKPGASTYRFRDPDKRRVYQRDLMRKRREKADAM